jgi:hypothetical protein
MVTLEYILHEKIKKILVEYFAYRVKREVTFCFGMEMKTTVRLIGCDEGVHCYSAWGCISVRTLMLKSMRVLVF